MSTWVPVIDRHFNPSIIAACLIYWETSDRESPYFLGTNEPCFLSPWRLILLDGLRLLWWSCRSCTVHSPSCPQLPAPPPFLPLPGERLEEFISTCKLLFCSLRLALCSSPANLYAHQTISWLCIVFQSFWIFCLGWCWRIFASRSPPGLKTSGLFTPFGEDCVILPHI